MRRHPELTAFFCALFMACGTILTVAYFIAVALAAVR